uniref:Uncharacterized protein n=2 Tax=Aegilops tauschii subsp. strangulata TaxID=200361 RepID=A0A453L8D7_AEGTS
PSNASRRRAGAPTSSASLTGAAAPVQFIGEMLKFRQMSRSSNGRQKIRKRVVKKEVSSIVSDRRKAVVENITQELATKLSPSIVSLASFDGDKMHFRSTGIVLANSSSGGACVLTSSALVSTSDKERMLTPALKVCAANLSALVALI